MAVIDRTADVHSAATSILACQNAFQGKSPYKPDVIYVNEWVKDKFLAACREIAQKEGQAVCVVSGKCDAGFGDSDRYVFQEINDR